MTSPSPFSPDLPTFQVAWDATSMSAFMECPRKYKYSILEGWRGISGSAALSFGTLYHNTLEQIDRLLAEGVPLDDALLIGLRSALQASGHYEEDQRWVPWSSLDSARTPATLCRAIIWYYEEWFPDQCQTVMFKRDGVERPALELSFAFSLPFRSPDDRELLWCGYKDKIVTAPGTDYLMVLERKTTKMSLGSSYFSLYTLSNQITGYILAGQLVYNLPVRGAIIDAAQTAVGFTRFGRSLQLRTEEQLAEWLENIRYWTGLAEHYAKINYWPMNLSSCNNFGGCRYRDVCSLPASLRAAALSTHFKIQRWNPLEVREETAA